MYATRTLVVLALVALTGRAADPEQYDVVIYGGTSGGVGAAVQTARMGKSVVVIEPSKHIGGLSSGGLGWTDSGNKAVIGGISREFYQRLKKHYDQADAWKHEKPEAYKFYRKDEDAIWAFEPHIAEKTFRAMLDEHKVKYVLGERLDRAKGKGVKKEKERITTIIMESGKQFSGKMFIDATYEGDLMAAAGVSYTTGREPNSKYNETLNGLARKWNVSQHRFVVKVDPYVKPGDPKSGLLFGIDKPPYPADGEGDHRLQAYCFRMCMSKIPENRVPFPKPEGYDEKMYELLFRNFEAGDMRLPLKPDMMPNGKTDTNNNCAVSTDFIGQNHAYPDASYEEREKIIKEHERYQKGLMWSLANHERVPKKIRDQMSVWGLPKDEFTDNGGWPHQIYVREARRMVGEYVMTERDCRRLRQVPMSVGMGSYNMDSHNCMRYVTDDGHVQNEGDVQVSPGGPYQISYQSIVPKKGECANLLVPVCVSSTHASYGSIRMEPVFIALGQSAATAAVFAIDDKIDVQDVKYEKLSERLLKDKQVLEYARAPSQGSLDLKSLKGIVLDDDRAERKGFESNGSTIGPYVGVGYRHDGGENRGKQTARYTPDLEKAEKYEVRMSYSPNANRATNVPVTIVHADGKVTKKINQRKAPTIDKAFLSLGTYRFEKGKAGYVEIGNEGVDGHVIIDAVQWIPVGESSDRIEMERIRVSKDSKGFVLEKSGKRFRPWGFNYDHDDAGLLLEDYWEARWSDVEKDFKEMKALGANVVRIHLQVGKFMDAADKANVKSLERFEKLVKLSEEVGLYLDVTGLGCYHKKDVPAWYDKLDEKSRWDVQARFWREVASRCVDSPAIFCYDLMNEPVVPGGKRKDGDWLGPAFGDKHFVQVITLDQAKRERPVIAREWIKRLVSEIRQVDKDHLITVGLVDWSLERPGLTSGFVPSKVADDLDFLCIHFYPEKDGLDKAIKTLEGFAAVGKPVVIEETFPLKCSFEEMEKFLDASKKSACGWISFYWGKPPEQLKKSSEFRDALLLKWLELFQKKGRELEQ